MYNREQMYYRVMEHSNMSLSREQEIVEYLKKTYNSKAIIKYGSFADGSANESICKIMIQNHLIHTCVR